MSSQLANFSEKNSLKIHWRLSQGGSSKQRTRQSMADERSVAQPDLQRQVIFAQEAERLGFDSLLVDFGLNKPDSTLLAMAVGQQTKTIKFIIACRSGLMSPTYFVQQLNTLSHFIPGRFSLNIVAGHSPKEQQAYGDFLDHDERYARTSEYLSVCRQLWEIDNKENRMCETAAPLSFCGEHYQIKQAVVKTAFVATQENKPDCFIAGSSSEALKLASEYGDIWVSLARTPHSMAADVERLIKANKAVAIRLSVICRETKKEAVAAAEQLVTGSTSIVDVNAKEHQFINESDSFGIREAYRSANAADSPWLNSCLWNGAVKSHGAPAIALVGTPEEIARAILQYRTIGISQFIFSGWPQYEEMSIFGQQVLPLLIQMAPDFLEKQNQYRRLKNVVR